MRIEDKIERIVQGRALPVKEVAGPSEADHRTCVPPSSTHYLFEPNSILSSPWRARPASASRNFIGLHSYVNAGGFLRDRLIIGRYTSVGQRVSLAAGQHRWDQVSTSPIMMRSRNSYTEKERQLLKISSQPPYTIIENDVWIGDGAVILPGVRVASGSIVAANAVVTEDVPPYTIVGGVPAKVIRLRFPEKVCDQLLASQWWNLPRATLDGLPADNVFRFVEEVSFRPRSPVHDVPTCRVRKAAGEAAS